MKTMHRSNPSPPQPDAQEFKRRIEAKYGKDFAQIRSALPAEGALLPQSEKVPVPRKLEFTQLIYPNFEVHWAKKQKNLVYHYWPPKDKEEFCPLFENHLERAYISIFASNITQPRIDAQKTSKEEAAILMQLGDTRPEKPRETYWVCVYDAETYLGWEKYLLSELFERIEKSILSHTEKQGLNNAIC